LKQREYVLYVNGPDAGAKGFPGKWSPEWDESEQIPGIEFQSDQPTQKESKIPMTVAPIKFSTLAELASGSPIVCIQGKITSLYDPKKGEGEYGPWVIQNATISDGTLKHDIAFMDEEHILPMSAKNKTIRVTAQEYKSKLKGIELKEKTVNGKPKRSVNVKFPAKIEVQEGGNWVDHVAGSGDGSEASSQPAAHEHTSSQPSAPSTYRGNSQSTERPAPSDEPVEERVANWVKVHAAVCDAVGHDAATELEGLSPSDIKEITTGIIMSFKEGYIHRAPHFAGDTQPGKSPQRAGVTDSQTQTTSGEEEAEAAPVGWRNAVHKGVKLGDYEEENLAAIIQWCLDNEPKTEAGRALKPQALLADTELRGAASKKVSKALVSAGMGTAFEEEDVESVCNEEFGSGFAELHYPSLFALGNSLAEYVEKMKAAFTTRQPKPAAGPKKIAKKVVSVEDDEEDMPG
jgi:hypothetical protein